MRCAVPRFRDGCTSVLVDRFNRMSPRLPTWLMRYAHTPRLALWVSRNRTWIFVATVYLFVCARIAVCFALR